MRRVTGMTFAVAAMVLALGATAAVSQDHEYVGAAKCKKCHLKQYKSWEATKMASAFELLKPNVNAEAKTAAGIDAAKDYTTDATCLSCHTTGYGKPGGFVDLESTPTLAGVGCESCHGPGGTYLQDGYMTLENKEYSKSELVAVGLVDTVGEAQCTQCHNADNPFDKGDFDFTAMKDKGTHEHIALKYSH
jgi:formate-dependent nitrite reductase cytochrome c552 subunit